MTRMPTAFATLLLMTTALSAQESADPLAAISASTVVTISDGDFVAATYGTGVLAPASAGFRDLLSVISIADGKTTLAEVPVSNSVTATPEALAVTPDGNTAFVIERLGERPDGGDTVRDLPAGNRLFAIDLTDKAAPKLVATVSIGDFPETVALSPDGTRVAVVSNGAEASLVEIVSFENGAFGAPARFDLAELGITGDAEAPRGGVTATSVDWHPSGNAIAVNINTQDRVAFFTVTGDGQTPNLRPWGEPVAVGRDPFVGRFTPDGGHYLTSNWGRDFAATSLEGRLPATPSTISVVRLADKEAHGAEARHEVLPPVDTDRSAEGLAVSPDGRMVATINMRNTAFPAEHATFDREATVTLLSFDPETGALAKIGDYPFEGVLPEGGAFDLTSEHFLATVFEGHAGAGPDRGAGIEVFRVVKGEAPGLERVGRMPLPHGVHHVVVR